MPVLLQEHPKEGKQYKESFYVVNLSFYLVQCSFLICKVTITYFDSTLFNVKSLCQVEISIKFVNFESTLNETVHIYYIFLLFCSYCQLFIRTWFFRQFVARYKQKCLQLFKLILLEKKVLFFKSPVSELSGSCLRGVYLSEFLYFCPLLFRESPLFPYLFPFIIFPFSQVFSSFFPGGAIDHIFLNHRKLIFWVK